MKTERCKECGAELKARSALCPLCGSRGEDDNWEAPRPAPVTPLDVDDYQKDLRKLRAELKKLRRAEAS